MSSLANYAESFESNQECNTESSPRFGTAVGDDDIKQRIGETIPKNAEKIYQIGS